MTPFLIGTAWTSVPPSISSASVLASPSHETTPAIAAPLPCAHSWAAAVVAFAPLPMQQPSSPSAFAPLVDAVVNVAPDVETPPWAGHPAAAAVACIGQPLEAPDELAETALALVPDA